MSCSTSDVCLRGKRLAFTVNGSDDTEENGSSLYSSTVYSTLRGTCSLYNESCASSDRWPIGRLASATTYSPRSKTLCTVDGKQYRGYSATKRHAVSLACWSQATIFTVLPLHKICSVTARLQHLAQSTNTG